VPEVLRARQGGERGAARRGRAEDYEPALTAFEQANKTAREQFTGCLAATLREIRLVEYTFSNNPVT
jgi:hypothetical protein